MEELKKRLDQIYHLVSIQSIVGWDERVNAPEKAAPSRAIANAHLSGLIHERFVAIDADGLLTGLKKDLDAGKLKGDEAVIVAEIWHTFSREKKLPEEFVKRNAATISESENAWAQARAKNDFSLFLPWLTKIVKLKQEEAGYVGYKDTPYDALLDVYEPGMTSKEVTKILGDLKNFLIPFIKQIKGSKVKIDTKKALGKFPLAAQFELNKYIAGQIGFDFSAGRLDISTHPFTSGFHPQDVRITTRYRENDLMNAIGSTIHEAGHGIYEQGLPHDKFGTPLAEATSLGIHESQSRMWENTIGKSRAFWKYFYPTIQRDFPKPFKGISLDAFYQIINKVEPSLIRVESDEVTYNIHIIIRFEIEKALIEGTLAPKDVPKVWNKKMKDYLGVDVPTNVQGMMQDVHWSAGLIGYFPTYTLGNLYAAQIYATMKKQMPKLDLMITAGKFAPIVAWLRKNIHAHGKRFKAVDLIKQVTGEKPNSAYFTDYLKKKYTEIYRL